MHIPFVDIAIVLLCLVSVFRGYQIGFIRQLGSTIGFVVGLYPGSVLSSALMTHIDSALKPVVGLAVLLAVCFTFMTLGEIIALRIKFSISNKPVQHIDNGLGSIVSVITLLLGVWLANALFQLAPASALQADMKDSRIISILERQMPPASSVLSSLNKLIDPNGSPQVFAGREPSPSATFSLPSKTTYAAMLARVQPSVVKIEGLGCGGIVDGSGWVLSPNHVVTNAHVVAGVRSPKVIDANGTHNTTVVEFDPKNDIAVLRTTNLAGKPLSMSTEAAESGTKTFALGFPGGGDYTVQPGVVLDEFTALGQDIYGQSRTLRLIYSVQTDIVPGNSGGPMVDTNGRVRGVVFATSTTYNNVGYVLTSRQVSSQLSKAATAIAATSTGKCSN